MLHGISISKGRSFCDRCKHPLSWTDNIPFFSYVLLGGKCKYCKSRISPRYPLIELTTAIFFSVIFLRMDSIIQNFSWLTPFGIISIIFLLFLAFVSMGIIVTDLEEMIIPDVFVFALFLISLGMLLFSTDQMIWNRLLVSFCSASFFLILHLVTKGKGMGLGDVKLALPFGLLLGFPLSLIWIFSSFIVGSVVGVGMLLFGKAKASSKIPFGPFLVIGFWISVFFGVPLLQYLTPLF